MTAAKQASFDTGEHVPHSGVYRIAHNGHRLPREVTLLAGATFPRCSQCSDRVQFEAVRYIPRMETGLDFKVIVYELPVEEEDGVSEALAG